MSNRFNYRCPKCGSPDQVEICAFVAVPLPGNGAAIAADVKDIDGSCWSSENAAGRDAAVTRAPSRISRPGRRGSFRSMTIAAAADTCGDAGEYRRAMSIPAKKPECPQPEI
jgi:hypothetical protein